MFKNSQKIAISKHILITTLFIVLMFTSFGMSMDEAYAADLNESVDVIKSELNVEDKLENSQDNILNTNENEESSLSSAEDTVLAEPYSLNGGTFSDIRRAIVNANNGDTIKLSGTFYPTKSAGKIFVDKNVTITSDSQAILDGKGISYMFMVEETAQGSVFNNLKMINGYRDGDGGAMFINAKNIKISNCVFENNHGVKGGAIYGSGDPLKVENLVLENCEFIRNLAVKSAAGATVVGNNTKVINCLFDSNRAGNNQGIIPLGGALQIGIDRPNFFATVDNCRFINNSVDPVDVEAHGGAGCVRSGVTYKNCIFINNSAGQGGALTYHGAGTIKNCTFIGNHAVFFGGALSSGYSYDIMELNIDNCSFSSNYAPIGGAAQLNGVNVKLTNSNFDDNYAFENGGAINIGASTVVIGNSSFNRNVANVDGGAVFIDGNDTLIQDSLFISNEAIPNVNELDDGLGGAIYINSTRAIVKNNEFYYNTARNGSAIYNDKSSENLELINNTLFENQAWVYALPIYAHDIYYTETEQLKSVIHGGNNIADHDNLAVSNAIYNAADNGNIVINGETPVMGATTTGRLYQDDREYNIEILMTVVHEDGTVVYNNTLNSNCFGEVFDNLTNLKVGKYFVTAKHFDDTYYKAISNTTTFNVISQVDNKVRKLVSGEEINYEDIVVWTLNITNNGPNNATNVTVTDVLPEGLVWLDDNTGGKYNPETGILHLDFLAVGEVFVVEIITMVNKTGSIVNNVNITSDEYDYNLTNNFDKQDINVQPASDLAVVKIVNQSMPNYNDLVKWTITVANNGPDIAHDVKVKDLLPSSLDWVSDTGLGSYNHDSGVWDIGTLNVNSRVSLEIVTRVKAVGTIQNNVSVSGHEHDNNMSNNHDSDIITVSPASDLAIGKLVNASVVDFGDYVKWTLVISNNGPCAATEVNVSDVLPNGFVYVNSSKPYVGGVIYIGDLAVGQTQSIDIVCRVNITGSFVNVASISGNEHDYNLSNNNANKSILINPASDLSVIKVVNETEPDFNDLVKWTITVENNGPDVAHDVVVKDKLPQSLIFVSSDGNYDESAGIWNVGTLDVGSRVSLCIISRVNATGIIENNVSVSGHEHDYNKSNNVDSQTIEVSNATDLSVIKLVNASVEDYHELIKWTIIASNNGPDRATGVYVMDHLPEGLILINYTASKGFYDNGIWSICCMERGDSQRLDIICYVNKTGEFTNFVNITGNEHDYILSNNVANESVLIQNAADVSIIKNVNNSNPYFGEVIEWNVTMINNGPDSANNIYAFDFLPRGLKYLNHVASKGIYDDGEWYVSSLMNGESAYLLIRCEVNSLESIENFVRVTLDEYDWNKSNNNDSEIINPISVTDLSITKLVNVSQANYLDLVKWTLIVTNYGPNDATGVFVSDVIVNGLQLIKTEGDGEYDNSIWDVGDLKSGQSKMLDLTCKIVATGEFENFACVWGNEYDPDLSNNDDEKSFYVKPASDLSITKTVSKYKYNVGDLVKYSIRVINKGPDKATNVEVKEIMDDSLILKSFKASYGDFDEISEIWSIDELDVGDSASLNINAIAEKPGVAHNNVSATSDNYDPDLTNNKDGVSISVTQNPKKDGVPKNHHVTKSKNEINGPYQSMLQNHVTGNPFVMALISVVFLLLVSCGKSFSKKR